MFHSNWLFASVCAVLALASSRILAAETASEVVDIRDERGNVLVAADRILSYDWLTHTFTLAPDERKKLAAELVKTTKLVSGIPFTIALDGKSIYSGKFTTVVSSVSQSSPVIIVDADSLNPNLGDDKLRIQLGYPTGEFFRGEDPRNDQSLRAALRSSGKLAKAPPEYQHWISDVMQEIQAIKPGMTRGQLLQVFETEGGISTRTQRRYAHRDCPFIKVNVRFDPVGSPDDKLINSNDDKIREISQPFLEWSIID